ncbi:hypothetical protein TIFTF001_013017, partial [Ficus carica]
ENAPNKDFYKRGWDGKTFPTPSCPVAIPKVQTRISCKWG